MNASVSASARSRSRTRDPPAAIPRPTFHYQAIDLADPPVVAPKAALPTVSTPLVYSQWLSTWWNNTVNSIQLILAISMCLIIYVIYSWLPAWIALIVSIVLMYKLGLKNIKIKIV